MGFLVLFLVMGLIGWAIGESKNRGGLGFILGFFLGFIGWIIVAVLPMAGVVCPHCRSTIDASATVCPKCTRQIQEE